MACERRYVWLVSGDPDKLLWLTKEDAERWAKEVYPNMDADRRYYRVYFQEVHHYGDTK
jgi:hypothetical protein